MSLLKMPRLKIVFLFRNIERQNKVLASCKKSCNYVRHSGENRMFSTVKEIDTIAILKRKRRQEIEIVDTDRSDWADSSCSSVSDCSQSFSNGLRIELINHLERSSLVDFDNKEAISRLQEAISFADILDEVEATGVEPMISPVHDGSLPLRVDKVVKTERSDILLNASLTEEDYFVAPPGNIPLESQKRT